MCVPVSAVADFSVTLLDEKILRQIAQLIDRDEPAEERLYRVRALIYKEVNPDNYEDWVYQGNPPSYK